MSENSALTQLAATIADIRYPANLVNAWTYPAQAASIKLSSLPVAIVSMRVGRDATIAQRIACEYWYTWTAEILIILAAGQLEYPGVASAYAEALQFNWPQAVADKLMDNLTLNGTCALVGEVGENVPILTVQHNHIHWEQDIYWGLIMTTQIAQVI